MLIRLLLAGILAAGLASAQRGGGGGGRGGGGGDMGGGMPMMTMSNQLDTMANALKLTKDQKKDVKTIMDEAQKEATPLREQLSKSEQAIGDAVQAGKTPDDLKDLLNSHGALEAQMAGIELQAFAKIYKLLEGDQVGNSKLVYPRMKGIFSGKNWNTME